jgi:hypothetical protein
MHANPHVHASSGDVPAKRPKRAGEAAASGGPVVRRSAGSLASLALRRAIVPTAWRLAIEGCRLPSSLDYDEPAGPSIMYARLIDAPGQQSRLRWSCSDVGAVSNALGAELSAVGRRSELGLGNGRQLPRQSAVSMFKVMGRSRATVVAISRRQSSRKRQRPRRTSTWPVASNRAVDARIRETQA